MIKDADFYLKNKQYRKAAKLYEEKAETTNIKPKKILLYQKAIEAYRELGSTDNEVRCLITISRLVDGSSKIDYLLACWRAYIKAIERYKYETRFEWKGEKNNIDEDYFDIIENYLSRAIQILKIIREIPELDNVKLFEILREECVNRENEGGWAADECWKSIHEIFVNVRS